MNEKRLKEFWNKEYKDPEFFSLSDEASGDLQKFTRWLQKEYGKDVLRSDITVLDAGCGNGRNLLWLNDQFRVRGFGYDISEVAIRQATENAALQKWGNKLTFAVHSIGQDIPLPDESVDIVLDMMASHFLKEKERAQFIKEVARVLKPQGVLFFKSFYMEGDQHAKDLVKNESAGEENAYIHPRLKVYEYVWTDQAIEKSFGANFTLQHKEASHKHNIRGKPNKRRSVVCYFEKK
ncbi:MAG TPA: class I SAM-dependent methyltransferase [Candidatus Paceibacterota bacterium]|jgi:ubiquinone/menaquinone biosynthesis C-methylase UbiE|nr:class I SAM-dependent methyltransferase [Candidatus Paceibacterota bacterium]